MKTSEKVQALLDSPIRKSGNTGSLKNRNMNTNSHTRLNRYGNLTQFFKRVPGVGVLSQLLL